MKRIQGPLNIISKLESINEDQHEQNSSMRRLRPGELEISINESEVILGCQSVRLP